MKKIIFIILFAITNISHQVNGLNSKKVGYGVLTGFGAIATSATLGLSFLGASALYVSAINFKNYKQIVTSNNYRIPIIITSCLLANGFFAYLTKKSYQKFQED